MTSDCLDYSLTSTNCRDPINYECLMMNNNQCRDSNDGSCIDVVNSMCKNTSNLNECRVIALADNFCRKVIDFQCLDLLTSGLFC